MTRTESPIPPAFLEVFRDLVRAYQPRQIDKETVRVYWDTLAEFPLDVLRGSAAALRRRSAPYFPTTSEWFQAATRSAAATRTRSWPSGDPRACSTCGGRGLVRIEYHSGDPYDLALCQCGAGEYYRQIGADGVRVLLALDATHHIAGVEDFEEDDR